LYFGGHFGFKMAAIANQMMNINSQHHNLLGTQISPKSEDFCIWWPFYAMVAMTRGLVILEWPPLLQKT
jgi:hypothetical protein